MTEEEIRERVEDIAVDDPARVRDRERDLWEQVLLAIALGRCEDPQMAAHEALHTTKYGLPS